MKLCEKIMKLRRQHGLSQEELADILAVSRQAVSKWESDQSMPDIDKIVMLSKHFDVTTDYLLKDENDDSTVTRNDTGKGANEFEGDGSHGTDTEYGEEACDDDALTYRASLDSVTEYLALKKREGRIIAIAVALFIISPILLITLTRLSDMELIGSTLAIVMGILAIFTFATLGIGLCIYSDMLLRKNPINKSKRIICDEKARHYAIEENKAHARAYTLSVIIGTALCIFSPIPLIVTALLGLGETIFMVDILLITVALAVAIFIRFGTVEEGERKIIDSARRNGNRISKIESIIFDIYWPLIVFSYLGVSFLTNRWDITWIIWPLSGVLSSLISSIIRLIADKKRGE